MGSQPYNQAASAGQPGVTIPLDVYNQVFGTNPNQPVNPIMGQPTQQVFQQPETPPPPAGTIAAMQRSGQTQFQPQGQAQPIQSAPNAYHAQVQQQPQQQAQQQPQMRPDLPAEVQDFIGKVESLMFGNGNQQQDQQQQMMQQQQSFFDTGWGKATMVTGGIGIGVLGTKIFGGLFGSSNNNVSSSDMSALGNAFKTLLK